ncbi:MAG: hypothetical protein RL490_2655, partial [Pseudomonadota bacterium]
MITSFRPAFGRFLMGASVLALGASAQPIMAQTASPATAAAADSENAEEIIVSGIRSSLLKSLSLKRDALGVVDAISAE